MTSYFCTRIPTVAEARTGKSERQFKGLDTGKQTKYGVSSRTGISEQPCIVLVGIITSLPPVVGPTTEEAVKVDKENTRKPEEGKGINLSCYRDVALVYVLL